MDARAHGATPGSEADLSISTLCADFGAVIKCMRQQWTAPHSIFLAGHSLGGSVAIWTVLKGLIEDVAGVIVIDIVEEAALRALTTMPRVLEERPQNFPSIEDAIRWAIHEKISRNPQSASISIPDQLCITEDECRWKVDLMKSQPHWDGWFRGLSEAFVECPTPRVLILAEREYLDRTLMIASMQGKFQNNILRGTGHAIQEDLPDELAELVGTFIDRGLLVARLNRGRTEIIR
jgi:protein phosphatase methylesterase 1